MQNPWTLSNVVLCEEVRHMAELKMKCHIEDLKSGVFGQKGHGDDRHGYCTKYLIECLNAQDFI
jgi:hypothetical protein